MCWNWHLAILLSEGKAENTVMLEAILVIMIEAGINSSSTPPRFLYSAEYRFAPKVLWQLCNGENKAFDPVWHKQKNPRKPWHKNCTVLFDHYWHCPYCVSPPTSLQSSSQRLLKYRCRCRKELVCTLEKYHFVSIKDRYVLRTVIKIDSHVLSHAIWIFRQVKVCFRFGENKFNI